MIKKIKTKTNKQNKTLPKPMGLILLPFLLKSWEHKHELLLCWVLVAVKGGWKLLFETQVKKDNRKKKKKLPVGKIFEWRSKAHINGRQTHGKEGSRVPKKKKSMDTKYWSLTAIDSKATEVLSAEFR